MRGGVAGGGSAVFAVQAASLKGEDKFIAEPDVRRSTSATARKRRGAETSGDLLACFAVFDGHVNASASSHAERRMLPALLECGANEPEALLETSCVSAFESVERSFKRGGTCGACFSRSGGDGMQRMPFSSKLMTSGWSLMSWTSWRMNDLGVNQPVSRVLISRRRRGRDN